MWVRALGRIALLGFPVVVGVWLGVTCRMLMVMMMVSLSQGFYGGVEVQNYVVFFYFNTPRKKQIEEKLTVWPAAE